MDISAEIIKGQDKNAMLQRALETLKNLYADKTHFVYELLQNAEDAGATCVKFVQFSDHLEVLHDGKPFTLLNLQRLCDIAYSDKNETSEMIGKFGVGFKSVFTICKCVILHSEPANRQIIDSLDKFAIRIDNYVDPTNITAEKIDAPYTTRFLFPYDCGEFYSCLDDLTHDIATKLRDLGAYVLLFLKNIKEIHYSIQGIGHEYDGSGTYKLNRTSFGETICKVKAYGEINDKFNNQAYLVFSRQIVNTERSVDIAFSIMESDDNVRFARAFSPYVSVYFPTETKSELNFIVQAPFDLTPNRSSLEEGSTRNKELMSIIMSLFEEAVTEIKNRGWMSLDFINLLPYDTYNPVYNQNWPFYPLHKSTLRLLHTKEIVPTVCGDFVNLKNAKMAHTSKLITLFEGQRICQLLNEPNAKWLSKDFTENSPLKSLHSFFKSEGAIVIKSDDLPRLLRDNTTFLKSVDDDWLSDFYSYLAHDVPSLLAKNGTMSSLATVPFVKTSDGSFHAPYQNRGTGRKVELESNIYVRPENSNYQVSGFIFVDEFFVQNCNELIIGLGLDVPDRFDYYIQELRAGKKAGAIEPEINLSQVKQAIQFLRKEQENAFELLTELLYIRVIETRHIHTPNEKYTYIICGSGNIYRATDLFGTSLSDYFAGISGIYILDEQFYLDGGLSESDIERLIKLGVRNSAYENLAEIDWKEGVANCCNINKFRRNLSFANIDEVLEIIKADYYHDSVRVKSKSKAIFMMLKKVENHLQGEWQYGVTKPEIREGVAKIVSILREGGNQYTKIRWLFTTYGGIALPTEVTRHELDISVYGQIDKKSDIYELLGLKKTEEDRQEEIVRGFVSQLKKYSPKQRELIIKSLIPEEVEDEADFDVDESIIEFPDEPIKDLLRLKNKMEQHYRDAPNVKYESVLRSIRTSREKDKEHIRFRYKGYCQMCETPSPYWEVAEIFHNPQKELAEMNLSLCPTCAAEYRQIRRVAQQMRQFAQRMIDADLACDCRITLADKNLRFTQTHLAEIQQILKLARS